ncbi:MAG: guanylate kinase [Deltaproteobacteria bacterium]|nr:guanylate kinase [Deltaproteobacteria bacterium]
MKKINGNANILIITAPSGTGKTTLTRRLVGEVPNIKVSVSVTTRAKRPGEENGIHYWFVNEEEFKQHVEANRLVEWVKLFGHYYGTTKDEIQRIIQAGQRVLLEIDVEGAHHVQNIYPESCTIFILPPTILSLWTRLSQRGTDTLPSKWRRLNTAKEELLQGKNFQHFIINDNLENAYAELKNLVLNNQAVKLSHSEGVRHCMKLNEEFETADWLVELRKKFKEEDATEHQRRSRS